MNMADFQQSLDASLIVGFNLRTAPVERRVWLFHMQRAAL
jgi:hypothetical protein